MKKVFHSILSMAIRLFFFLRGEHIRLVALCVFRQDDRILVSEGFSKNLKKWAYRPPGGGIEFGEQSQQAVEREIREELGAEIRNVRFLGTLENVFSLGRRRGHQIAFVYEAKFVDATFYDRDRLVGHEDFGLPFDLIWKDLADFDDSRIVLLPSGLRDIL